MKNFLQQLKQRNKSLYYFGCTNIFCAIACGVIMQFDHTIVLGINAWIKPTKFFISLGIYGWTMGWLLYYLNEPRKVKRFNVMVWIVSVFEMGYIVYRAAHGQKSHFNFSSPAAIMLFALMGIAITILVVWTGYMAVLFFRRSFPQLPRSYLWGIRLGLVFFVIFAMSAHFMASSGAHTVGAPDGSTGLPLVNWSTRYGDLRAAHFFGMHALQILPLFGYYITRNTRTIVVVSLVYFIITIGVFVQALIGKPLLHV